MIKTLSISYSNTEKTAEIMSRYRPIAPKPETQSNPTTQNPKMTQSPYLRNIWSQLQARPTRTRKRGRATLSVSPPSLKRQKTQMLGFSPPCHITNQLSPQLPILNLQTINTNFENPPEAIGTTNLVTLSLLPCLPCKQDKLLDLNTAVEIPEDKDLLKGKISVPNVIAPQPLRPVGSTIRVGCISEELSLAFVADQTSKKAEEVEAKVEAETLPAIISDSNNKVRIVNSAYKEMVGQPECCWLDSMVSRLGRGVSWKRISGEVQLQFSESKVPISSKGFSCWVRIEWGSGGKKNSTNAYCDVIRLRCESKDYVFVWRFHIRTREAS